MRRKKTADREGYGRLLDAWIPPATAGEALGCFATTFTFQSGFFETECLGRMLQLECDPDTSGAAYLLEREEKMARLMCAGVVVDAAYARGQRSLRWDLIPFRAEGGILHAKLSILLWQNHARVIVASANLTESGYRQNLEVFVVWDFARDGSVPATHFGSACDFAEEVLDHCRRRNGGDSPAIDRSRRFLSAARRRVSDWLPRSGGPARQRMALVPVTPRTPSLFAQVQALWPDSSPPDTLFVLSPFFDPGAKNACAIAAWSLLRRRGKACIRYSVVAERVRDGGKLHVHAPESLAHSLPSGMAGGEIVFSRITGLDGRSLHAKALRLRGPDQILHCVGSSNFTSAGTGIGNERNWELNVAAWVRQSDRQRVGAHLAAWPDEEREPIDPDAVEWDPAIGTEDVRDPKTCLLPDWCGTAVYAMERNSRATLTLSFLARPEGVWSVTDETGTNVLVSHETLAAGTGSCSVSLDWKEPRPPSELLVRVAGAIGEARWPVEIRSFADLPPPQELRTLDLDQLLEVLTSALPLHRLLGRLRQTERLGDGPGAQAIELDPLHRYSRESLLLERTRRFSRAMTGMRRRLETPIPSEEYLDWRLNGPIGVAKLAEAILKEATSDGEKAFLLGELALELSQVRPKTEVGFLPKRRIREAIRAVVLDLTRQTGSLLGGAEAGLGRYVKQALRKARE